MSISNRWFPLPEKVRNHAIMNEMRNDHKRMKRFTVVSAGRRSFKTEHHKRAIIRNVALRAKNQNLFICAPTFDQVKAMYWADISRLSEGLLKSKSLGELMFEYHTGTRIYLVGLNNPERFEGRRMWHGGLIDEAPDNKERAWTDSIRPALADTKGYWWFFGVPNGRNWYYDLFNYALTGEDKEWSAFTWKSADVLDEAEVESAKRQLDERTFRQEFEASFETAGGIVYDGFSELNITSAEFNPNLPCTICVDFNVEPNPFARCIIQNHDGREIVIHEFLSPCRTTREAMLDVSEWLDEKGHQDKVILTGDYAGNQRRSVASMSDWNIIDEVFGNRMAFRRVTPTVNIRNRINALNSLFSTASGNARLFVNHTCKTLRWEL